MITLTAYPYVKRANIEEVELKLQVTKEEWREMQQMEVDELNDFVKSKATITVTDFNVDYEISDIDELEKE